MDSGANTNVQDKDGRTPLHEAVQSHMLTQLRKLTGSASDLTAVSVRRYRCGSMSGGGIGCGSMSGRGYWVWLHEWVELLGVAP